MPTTVLIAIGAGRPTGLPGSWSCPGSDCRTEEKTMLKRVCWIAIAAASLASGVAAAQTFPSRTIHLVSGVTPGSASDTTARIVATTAGIGSSTHMNLERFRIAAGIEVLHVPMKGAPDALTEVLTGRADFYFALPFQVGPQVKEGKLRALAVGSPKRSALFPDVPTTVETGYPNSDYTFRIGALRASTTPRDIVLRLNKEFNAAVSSPEVREKFLKLGVDPLSMSLPDFEAMIKK